MQTKREREIPPAKATPPHFKVPAGACDCHWHLFDLDPKYKWEEHLPFEPIQNALKDLRAMHKIVGVQRGIFVHAGLYADNALLMDSLKADKDIRGIALIKPETTDEELRALDKAGARGIRISAATEGLGVLDQMEAFSDRIAPLGWHLQFHFPGKLLPQLAPRIKKLSVPNVVLDHCARITPAEGPDGPEFKAFRDLIDTGKVWVKLSAPYRISKQNGPYTDALPVGKALVAAAKDRAVWGTDWPNSMYSGEMPDAGMLLDVLNSWCPDEATRDKILVDNPAKLYGFS